MADDELSMERRILRVMRKTLASVVKDATPQPGTSGFLSDQTVEDIKECFLLISLREKELAEAVGLARSRPYYPDQQKAGEVINFARPGKPDPEKH